MADSNHDNIIENYLITYKLQNVKKNIFKSKNITSISDIQSYPLLNMGYHYWITDLKKEKTEYDKFINKKKVYKVLNKFNINIDNYENDIENLINKNLKIKIISDEFCKIWELLFYFDIIKKDSTFKSLEISNYKGAYTQCIMNYRNKYFSKSKDTYILANNKDINTDISKNKNVKVIQTLSNLDKNYKNNINLIIGGCKFEQIPENLREQSVFEEIFEQILYATKCQSKGGNLILKFVETYSIISLKLVIILQELYETVNIIKPLTSDISNTEKFVVCQNFKLNKNTLNYIKILEKIYNEINKKQKKDFITDIFNEYNLDNDYKKSFININSFMSNIKFLYTNKTLDFIKEQNYHGNKYTENRENQIKASILWNELFLPDKLENSKKILSKIIDSKNEFITKKLNVMKKKIID